jgi:hypothetical protein
LFSVFRKRVEPEQRELCAVDPEFLRNSSGEGASGVAIKACSYAIFGRISLETLGTRLL